MNTPIFDSLAAKLTIEALDWEHVPACESRWHEDLPSHEADVFGGKKCGCTRYLCEEALEASKAPGFYKCPTCSHTEFRPSGTSSGFYAWIYPINNK